MFLVTKVEIIAALTLQRSKIDWMFLKQMMWNRILVVLIRHLLMMLASFEWTPPLCCGAAGRWSTCGAVVCVHFMLLLFYYVCVLYYKHADHQWPERAEGGKACLHRLQTAWGIMQERKWAGSLSDCSNFLLTHTHHWKKKKRKRKKIRISLQEKRLQTTVSMEDEGILPNSA